MFIEGMKYYADSNQANRGKEWGRGKIITETRQDGNKWDTILIEWGEGGGGGADMNSRCTFEGAVVWNGVLAWIVLGGGGGESLGGAF